MKLNFKIYLSLIAAIVACTQTVDVQTYQEAEDPVPVSDRSAKLWQTVGKLESVWASVDSLYSRSEVPYLASEKICKLEGWRGETLNAQFLLYTGSGAENVICTPKNLKSDNATLSSEIIKAQFVRYTLADLSTPDCRCHRNPVQPAILSPDMIDTLKVFNIEPCTTRPVWVTISIPQDATPGVYESEIIVSYKVKEEELYKSAYTYNLSISTTS